jgi:hypothetical protein
MAMEIAIPLGLSWQCFSRYGAAPATSSQAVSE